MAWYNASWLYRFKITSDQTKVDEAIDNLYYKLADAPAGFWSHVNATDGRDIRVTQADQITEVAREISGFYQGSQVGSLFIKADGLSASLDTDYYVYYGNSGASEPAASATYGRNNVWTSLLAVMHLDEASGALLCSKDGTTSTPVSIGYEGTGKLHTGITFDADADRANFGNNYGITAASLTLSAWINPSSLANFRAIVSKCSTSILNGYQFLWTAGGELKFRIGDAGAFDDMVSNSSVLTTGALQYVVVTYDGSNVRFYVSAVAQGVSPNTRVPTNSTDLFAIGNYSNTDFNVARGVIDEVRVSTSVRSQNWITTEYNNQNSPSTFWTTGAETQDVVVSPALTWLPRQMILRGPRGLMIPSGPIPPVTPEA